MDYIKIKDMRLWLGDKSQLTLEGENGVDISNGVIWSSSDKNVATIDQNGNLKGVGVGSAKILAELNGDSGKVFYYFVSVVEKKHIIIWLHTTDDGKRSAEIIKNPSKKLLDYIAGRYLKTNRNDVVPHECASCSNFGRCEKVYGGIDSKTGMFEDATIKRPIIEIPKSGNFSYDDEPVCYNDGFYNFIDGCYQIIAIDGDGFLLGNFNDAMENFVIYDCRNYVPIDPVVEKHKRDIARKESIASARKSMRSVGNTNGRYYSNVSGSRQFDDEHLDIIEYACKTARVKKFTKRPNDDDK